MTSPTTDAPPPAEAGGPVVGDDGLARCPWAVGHPLNRDYHDTEWGTPITGEAAWFERLTLEAFQAGLSWLVILAKRPAFREAFDGFDVDRVAAYDDVRLDALLEDARIVRNRQKIVATRDNARAAVALRDRGGLEALVTAHRPASGPAPATVHDVPTRSAASAALGDDLRRHGFRFVGPTSAHALMEATGLLDTHLVGCHRRGVGRA